MFTNLQQTFFVRTYGSSDLSSIVKRYMLRLNKYFVGLLSGLLHVDTLIYKGLKQTIYPTK